MRNGIKWLEDHVWILAHFFQKNKSISICSVNIRVTKWPGKVEWGMIDFNTHFFRKAPNIIS